ncbi:MAG: UDP-N-acetylmuramoyl-L-alanine--D-glutamate ligase [Flavobacteriaceae bacterium]
MKEQVVVLGAGESGVGAALLAQQQGYDVFVSDAASIPKDIQIVLDQAGIAWEENKHSFSAMEKAHWIIKSPGIPNNVKLIQDLRAKNRTLLSEIEFASRFTNATIIAITGSNGKTTTTMLTYSILKEAGLSVVVGGNIGTSFARLVKEETFDYCILEISSFQLDDIQSFAPKFGVITNITPDHLDRYDNNLANYVKAKLNLTNYQTSSDFLVVNADDPILVDALKQHPHKAQRISFSLENKTETHLVKDHIVIQNNNSPVMINTTQFPLKGRHNLLNAMAAATVANLLSISKEQIQKSLTHFQGAPHRMEKAFTIQKVDYINDSKATNVNATYFALESISTPVIWIAGGVDKGNDYNSLLPLVRQKVKAIICLGVNNEKLLDVFSGLCEPIIETQSMSEAVKICHKIAGKNETVLLSPACASFDLFTNYEDRGNQFKSAVQNL